MGIGEDMSFATSNDQPGKIENQRYNIHAYIRNNNWVRRSRRRKKNNEKIIATEKYTVLSQI